jgi:hypothetical protein
MYKNYVKEFWSGYSIDVICEIAKQTYSDHYSYDSWKKYYNEKHLLDLGFDKLQIILNYEKQ